MHSSYVCLSGGSLQQTSQQQRVNRGGLVQVLANPSVDLLESPAVTKEQLKSLGVRPYGPKVGQCHACWPHAACCRAQCQKQMCCVPH